MYVCAYVYLYRYVYVYMYIYTYMYVCICINSEKYLVKHALAFSKCILAGHALWEGRGGGAHMFAPLLYCIEAVHALRRVCV